MDASDKPQIVEHANKSLTLQCTDVRWVPSSARFALVGQCARGTGVIQVYSLRHGAVELETETEKQHAFKCCTFGASSLEERHLATGDFDGRLSIWNLEHPGVPVYSVKAHTKIINAIDGCGGLNVGYGAPEIATGSRDGAVKVWDPRQPDVPVASLEPKSAEIARDCWTVAFGNSYSSEERCVAAAYDNGDVKLYDLRTNMIRWETNIKNAVCSIDFDRKDIEMNKLVCTALESQFRVFDMRTYHPKTGFASSVQSAHKSTVWCCRHLPQNRDVWATTGGNGSVDLWRYKYPPNRSVKDVEGIPEGVMGTIEAIQHKVLSTQPINSFDWHPDKIGLCVMGAYDQSVRVCIVTKLNTL